VKRPVGYDVPPAPAPPTSARRGAGRSTRTPERALPPDGMTPAQAARLLRRASRARRRAEKSEVRRFTRHSRRRRIAVLVGAGALLGTAGLVTAAAFSPLFALRTIEVQGATRIAEGDLRSALDDQLGTPLPLLDLGRVQRELAGFPLIQSFVTESRPPDTLVVRIVERTPVGVVRDRKGFDLVDSAGVTLQSTAKRPDGYPVVELTDADVRSIPFRAAAAVLVALPADLAAQVDSITARTTDDVSLKLRGGQRVAWGSASDSVRKAQHLALLLKQNPAEVHEYDVSSPGVGILR
jgi:cell division protein FtsQ